MTRNDKACIAISSSSVVLIFAFAVIAIVCSAYQYKDLTVKVTATKISEFNTNDNRIAIGYADTPHGSATVYDRPVDFEPWHTTFEYEYKGDLYHIITSSVTRYDNIIDIYINPNNPSEYCFSSEKVTF